LCDVVSNLQQPTMRRVGSVDLQPLEESKTTTRRAPVATVKTRTAKPGNVSAKAKDKQRQWWAGRD